MKKKNIGKPVLVIISIFFSLGLAEGYVRYKGYYGVDGNFFFRYRKLKPFKLPLKSVEKSVELYLQSPTSYYLYDPELGWTIRPNSESHDKLYKSNSFGLRSAPTETSLEPVQGRLRIALFGDSFTHSNDIPYERTWGHFLEISLKKRGINAEALNFGVPAYGVDQAFLRWKKLGRKLSPNIVIFGFVSDDVFRNFNVFWPVRQPGYGFFFSKPRFVLSGNSLKLVNSPAIPPTDVMKVLKNFDRSDMAEYEYFYRKPDYVKRIWHNSKFITLFLDIVYDEQFRYRKKSYKNNEIGSYNFFDPEGEPGQLTLKIVAQFKKDVEAHGAKFIIVHFPWFSQLKLIAKGRELRYSELLEEFDKTFGVVHPEEEMLRAISKDSLESLFAGHYVVGRKQKVVGHYSQKANQVVADVLTKHILKLLEESSIDKN